MTTGGPPKLQRYSTSQLPERDRHEAWVNRDWPSLAPLYGTTPLEPFDTQSDRLLLGSLVLHYVRITAQEWRRDEKMLRSYDPDSLSMIVTLEGEAKGVFGGRDGKTGPGDAQFADLSLPSHHVSTGSNSVLISIPRKIAAQRGFDVAALHGVSTNGAAVRLLTSHLLAIRSAGPGLPAGSGDTLSKGILDLIGLVVAASGRPVAGHAVGRDGLRIAACRLIDEELGAHRLGPAFLCQRLRISRSNLHRLFGGDGGVQGYIRNRRLEAVRTCLADPAFTEPLHLVAERFGFSDGSHLSRLFRAAYGETPRDFRARSKGE